MYIALLVPILVLGLELDSYYKIPKFEVRVSIELKEPSQLLRINGTEYHCHVPSPEEWLESVEPEKPTEAQHSQAINVANEFTNCTYIVEGYWGYKLCHNQEIRQIKTEIEKNQYIFPPDSPAFSLGNKSLESPTIELRNGIWQLKVEYVKGDTCDLTGEPRKTNVFYYCDETVSKETFDNLRETHICQYEFSVASNKLCGILPSSKPRINFIECYSESLVDSLEMQQEELLGQELSVQDRPDPELDIPEVRTFNQEESQPTTPQDIINMQGDPDILVDLPDISAQDSPEPTLTSNVNDHTEEHAKESAQEPPAHEDL